MHGNRDVAWKIRHANMTRECVPCGNPYTRHLRRSPLLRGRAETSPCAAERSFSSSADVAHDAFLLLGSRLVNLHSQNITVAARATAAR